MVFALLGYEDKGVLRNCKNGLVGSGFVVGGWVVSGTSEGDWTPLAKRRSVVGRVESVGWWWWFLPYWDMRTREY